MVPVFKGLEKDILKAVRDRNDMILQRDALAGSGRRHSSLSSNEYLIDPGDVEVSTAFNNLANHAIYLLSLTRA